MARKPVYPVSFVRWRWSVGEQGVPVWYYPCLDREGMMSVRPCRPGDVDASVERAVRDGDVLRVEYKLPIWSQSYFLLP